MTHNCPICNKAGLPDYRQNEVVCPQCNSDLKAFLLLQAISKPVKRNRSLYFNIGISLLSIVLLTLLLNTSKQKNDLVFVNTALNDSINKIQRLGTAAIPKNGPNPIADKNETSLNYIVKKGDCPYKIARFFYNDGNKFRQIEADNNLLHPYILKVGEVLTIKIVQ